MSLANITIGKNAPNTVNVVVEIPKGTKNKYEYNDEMDAIVLDRVIHSSVIYPVNYGFIPHTHAEDGDHLDALILGNDPIFPGCVVEIRPIGILKMEDDKGMDWKIIGTIVADAKSSHNRDITDLSQAFKDELTHFFEVYKQLEGKTVTVQGFANADEARKAILDRMDTAGA